MIKCSYNQYVNNARQSNTVNTFLSWLLLSIRYKYGIITDEVY
jgi:hypothetical protein